MLSLPLTVWFLYFACPNKGEGFCLQGVNLMGLRQMTLPVLSTLVDSWAIGLVLAWFAWLVALERVLPGEVAEGVVLPNGKRLPYKLNGHLSLWVTLFLVQQYTMAKGGRALTYLYDDFIELATAAMLLSTLLSVGLYCASFRRGALLAHGGRSGYLTYDFWMGRELNPRIGSFDLKVFCELRPGMIGWLLIDFGMMAKEREYKGENSLEMLLLVSFQMLYVWDALYNEKAILTTMDVTTDGFGFMLAFGDLAWVPFTYCLPARYLATRSSNLPTPVLLAFAALGLAGFYIFRASNSEKDAFRRDPSSPACRHLQSMPTQRGTKLLVSGWWGLARKINYSGDWLFGLSQSLFTGFGCGLTYFYPIYFAILLFHRAARDDEACQAKYGQDWTRYKQRVPYMFIPKVF